MEEIILKCPDCSHRQKAYFVGDEEKIVKCAKCGAKMEPCLDDESKDSKICPKCDKILSSDDVLCIGCGFNFSTGKRMKGIDAKIKHKKEKKSILGRLVMFLVIICFAASIWYFGINKIIVMIKIHKSNYSFEELRFDQSIIELEYPSALGSQKTKDFADLRKKQILLEKSNNSIEENISSKTIYVGLIESITAPINLMYLRFELQNRGEEPLIVDERYFYLKSRTGHGNIALSRLKNPEVNFIPLTLDSGQTLKAVVCVKYVPAIRLDPEGGKDELLYFVFNNGEAYLQIRINPLSIWILTSRDVFEEWKLKIE